jgi:hypothetical protein
MVAAHVVEVGELAWTLHAVEEEHALAYVRGLEEQPGVKRAKVRPGVEVEAAREHVIDHRLPAERGRAQPGEREYPRAARAFRIDLDAIDVDQLRAQGPEDAHVPGLFHAGEQHLRRRTVVLGPAGCAVADLGVPIGREAREEIGRRDCARPTRLARGDLGEQREDSQDLGRVEALVALAEGCNPVPERRHGERGDVGRRLCREGESNRCLPRRPGRVVAVLGLFAVARLADERRDG